MENEMKPSIKNTSIGTSDEVFTDSKLKRRSTRIHNLNNSESDLTKPTVKLSTNEYKNVSEQSTSTQDSSLNQFFSETENDLKQSHKNKQIHDESSESLFEDISDGTCTTQNEILANSTPKDTTKEKHFKKYTNSKTNPTEFQVNRSNLETENVSKVFKIISKPNCFNASSDGKGFLKSSLKTYTNPRKSSDKSDIVESFALPDNPIISDKPLVNTILDAEVLDAKEITLQDLQFSEEPWFVLDLEESFSNLREIRVKADPQHHVKVSCSTKISLNSAYSDFNTIFSPTKLHNSIENLPSVFCKRNLFDAENGETSKKMELSLEKNCLTLDNDELEIYNTIAPSNKNKSTCISENDTAAPDTNEIKQVKPISVNKAVLNSNEPRKLRSSVTSKDPIISEIKSLRSSNIAGDSIQFDTNLNERRTLRSSKLSGNSSSIEINSILRSSCIAKDDSSFENNSNARRTLRSSGVTIDSNPSEIISNTRTHRSKGNESSTDMDDTSLDDLSSDVTKSGKKRNSRFGTKKLITGTDTDQDLRIEINPDIRLLRSKSCIDVRQVEGEASKINKSEKLKNYTDTITNLTKVNSDSVLDIPSLTKRSKSNKKQLDSNAKQLKVILYPLNKSSKMKMETRNNSVKNEMSKTRYNRRFNNSLQKLHTPHPDDNREQRSTSSCEMLLELVDIIPIADRQKDPPKLLQSKPFISLFKYNDNNLQQSLLNKDEINKVKTNRKPEVKNASTTQNPEEDNINTSELKSISEKSIKLGFTDRNKYSQMIRASRGNLICEISNNLNEELSRSYNKQKKCASISESKPNTNIMSLDKRKSSSVDRLETINSRTKVKPTTNPNNEENISCDKIKSMLDHALSDNKKVNTTPSCKTKTSPDHLENKGSVSDSSVSESASTSKKVETPCQKIKSPPALSLSSKKLNTSHILKSSSSDHVENKESFADCSVTYAASTSKKEGTISPHKIKNPVKLSLSEDSKTSKMVNESRKIKGSCSENKKILPDCSISNIASTSKEEETISPHKIKNPVELSLSEDSKTSKMVNASRKIKGSSSENKKNLPDCSTSNIASTSKKEETMSPHKIKSPVEHSLSEDSKTSKTVNASRKMKGSSSENKKSLPDCSLSDAASTSKKEETHKIKKTVELTLLEDFKNSKTSHKIKGTSSDHSEIKESLHDCSVSEAAITSKQLETPPSHTIKSLHTLLLSGDTKTSKRCNTASWKIKSSSDHSENKESRLDYSVSETASTSKKIETRKNKTLPVSSLPDDCKKVNTTPSCKIKSSSSGPSENKESVSIPETASTNENKEILSSHKFKSPDSKINKKINSPDKIKESVHNILVSDAPSTSEKVEIVSLQEKGFSSDHLENEDGSLSNASSTSKKVETLSPHKIKSPLKLSLSEVTKTSKNTSRKIKGSSSDHNEETLPQYSVSEAASTSNKVESLSSHKTKSPLEFSLSEDIKTSKTTCKINSSSFDCSESDCSVIETASTSKKVETFSSHKIKTRLGHSLPETVTQHTGCNKKLESLSCQKIKHPFDHSLTKDSIDNESLSKQSTSSSKEIDTISSQKIISENLEEINKEEILLHKINDLPEKVTSKTSREIETAPIKMSDSSEKKSLDSTKNNSIDTEVTKKSDTLQSRKITSLDDNSTKTSRNNSKKIETLQSSLSDNLLTKNNSNEEISLSTNKIKSWTNVKSKSDTEILTSKKPNLSTDNLVTDLSSFIIQSLSDKSKAEDSNNVQETTSSKKVEHLPSNNIQTKIEISKHSGMSSQIIKSASFENKLTSSPNNKISQEFKEHYKAPLKTDASPLRMKSPSKFKRSPEASAEIAELKDIIKKINESEGRKCKVVTNEKLTECLKSRQYVRKSQNIDSGSKSKEPNEKKHFEQNENNTYFSEPKEPVTTISPFKNISPIDKLKDRTKKMIEMLSDNYTPNKSNFFQVKGFNEQNTNNANEVEGSNEEINKNEDKKPRGRPRKQFQNQLNISESEYSEHKFILVDNNPEKIGSKSAITDIFTSDEYENILPNKDETDINILTKNDKGVVNIIKSKSNVTELTENTNVSVENISSFIDQSTDEDLDYPEKISKGDSPNIKRGRGRPRKLQNQAMVAVLDDPVKTPENDNDVNIKYNSQQHRELDNTEIEDITKQLITKRGRGRPRNIRKQSPVSVIDDCVKSPTKDSFINIEETKITIENRFQEEKRNKELNVAGNETENNNNKNQTQLLDNLISTNFVEQKNAYKSSYINHEKVNTNEEITITDTVKREMFISLESDMIASKISNYRNSLDEEVSIINESVHLTTKNHLVTLKNKLKNKSVLRRRYSHIEQTDNSIIDEVKDIPNKPRSKTSIDKRIATPVEILPRRRLRERATTISSGDNLRNYETPPRTRSKSSIGRRLCEGDVSARYSDTALHKRSKTSLGEKISGRNLEHLFRQEYDFVNIDSEENVSTRTRSKTSLGDRIDNDNNLDTIKTVNEQTRSHENNNTDVSVGSSIHLENTNVIRMRNRSNLREKIDTKPKETIKTEKTKLRSKSLASATDEINSEAIQDSFKMHVSRIADNSRGKSETVKELKRSLSVGSKLENSTKRGKIYKYKLGDVAWAQFGRYPYWPCLISKEPQSGYFKKISKQYLTEKLFYHVIFFGDKGRRAWISGHKMFPYTCKDDIQPIYGHLKEYKYIRRHLITRWASALDEVEFVKSQNLSINEKVKYLTTVNTLGTGDDLSEIDDSDSKAVLKKNAKPLKDEEGIEQAVKEKITERVPKKRKHSLIEGDLDKTTDDIHYQNVKKKIKLSNTEKLSKKKDADSSDSVVSPKKEHKNEISKETEYIFIKDEHSDTEYKMSLNTIKHFGTYSTEEQRALFKRNNLFKGVQKEKVCQYCFEFGELMKCKGGCNGVYHSYCATQVLVEKPPNGRKRRSSLTKIETVSDKSDVNKEKQETVSSVGNQSEVDESHVQIVTIPSSIYNTPPRNTFPPDVLNMSLAERIDFKMKEVMNKIESTAYTELIADSCEEKLIANSPLLRCGFSSKCQDLLSVGKERSPQQSLELDKELDNMLKHDLQITPVDVKKTEDIQNFKHVTADSPSPGRKDDNPEIKHVTSDAENTSAETSTKDNLVNKKLFKKKFKPRKSIIKHITADSPSTYKNVNKELDGFSSGVPMETKTFNGCRKFSSKHVTADSDSIDSESLQSSSSRQSKQSEISETPDSYKNNKPKFFKCGFCTEDVDPYCFICNELVSKKGSIRQKCSIYQCPRFYHPACLKLWPQTQWSLIQTTKNRYSQEEVDSFVCPQHVCHTCASDDPRAAISRCPWDKIVRCLCCPASYHSTNLCVPAGTEIITSTSIICPRHRNKSKQYTINTTWCLLCNQGGNLICCETCPTSVHPECMTLSLTDDERFICEDCESGRLPLYDEVVWVKLGKYKWWPSLILFPNEVPLRVLNAKHSVGEFVVKFFGTYDYYWVNRGRAFLFQEGDTVDTGINAKKKVEAAFMKAVKEAVVAHKMKKQFKLMQMAESANSMKPPPYIKIKVSKPVGNVRLMELDLSNTTACDCDPNQRSPCGPDSNCLNRLLLTECNPEVCPAGKRCKNQSFEKREYPMLVPYKTETRGWGLKSLEPIKKGQFVIEYVGELIDDEEYQRRVLKMHEQKEENYYFLTIHKDRMIDAGPKGNMARFMNHCCQPNCETQKWTVNGDTKVGLFATEDIPAQTELTFNYNLECTGTERKVCKCGAPNCSGFIGVKVKNDSTESKKPKKERKKKEPEKPMVLPPCFLCQRKGNVSLCNNKICNKAYHFRCLKLKQLPEGKKFVCPWHYCNTCSKRTIRCCVKCLNSFCPSHSEGNVRYDNLMGFVCNVHDPTNPTVETSNVTLRKKRNNVSTDETVVTSTTDDNDVNDDGVSLLRKHRKSIKNKGNRLVAVDRGDFEVDASCTSNLVIGEDELSQDETVSSATASDVEDELRTKRKKKSNKKPRTKRIKLKLKNKSKLKKVITASNIIDSSDCDTAR